MRNGPSKEMVVASAFQEWLQQGEHLYNNALREYHDLERQLAELESRLVEKQTEVNQIAQIIGKPAVEGNRRLSAQLVAADVIDVPPDRTNTPGSNANIARALTGKFGR
jgi:H2-forming N5,N10-methylenetetrahydromethanopterin dehydrogenase-like enzyme